MKAVYGYVRQVKKQLTTNLAIIEIEIDKAGYKDVVSLLDDQPVFVTLAGDIKGGYGVIDSEPEPEQTPASKKFTELRPSAQAAIRCKDERFREWLSTPGWIVTTEEDAAAAVRERCEVKSRRQLDVSGGSQNAWVMLNNQYCLQARYPDKV